MESETTIARVHDDIWYSSLHGSSTISGGMLGQYARGIEIEEAQVDLDVAVGRLNAAQLQNARAQPRHARIVGGQPGQFQARSRPSPRR